MATNNDSWNQRNSSSGQIPVPATTGTAYPYINEALPQQQVGSIQSFNKPCETDSLVAEIKEDDNIQAVTTSIGSNIPTTQRYTPASLNQTAREFEQPNSKAKERIGKVETLLQIKKNYSNSSLNKELFETQQELKKKTEECERLKESNKNNEMKIQSICEKLKKEEKVCETFKEDIDQLTNSGKYSSDSVSTNTEYVSSYEVDFVHLGYLGGGGGGVVFKAKKKIDSCEYAVKQIYLPSTCSNNRREEECIREVEALSGLYHKNIVRYFHAWLEAPPKKWQIEKDKKLFKGCSDIPSQIYSDSEETEDEASDISDESHVSKDPEDSSGIFFVESSNCKHSNIQTEKDVINESHVPEENEDNVEMYLVYPSNSNDENDISPRKGKCTGSLKFLYLQMELCKAVTLEEWLKENKQEISLKERMTIFLQIVNAVEYIHSRDMIHRDLKPANIFFALDDSIKVGDFGLVTQIRRRTHKCKTCKIESQTCNVGTPRYMSPEQKRNEIYTQKVDIYALGLILFELLCCFSTEMEKMKAISDLKSGNLSDSFANTPQGSLVKLLTSEDPSLRPKAADITEKIKNIEDPSLRSKAADIIILILTKINPIRWKYALENIFNILYTLYTPIHSDSTDR